MVILPAMRSAQIILLLFFAFGVQAQNIVKDLSNHWMVYEGTKYISAQESSKSFQTIHFSIKPLVATGATLEITYPEPFVVFVNNKLFCNCVNGFRIKTDSLREMVNNPTITISVYQANLDKKKLTTYLSLPNLISDTKTQPVVKPKVPSDFVIVSAALIIVLLLTIILLNPKLASDYFSFTKLISLREREESQVYNRIAGSTNFLFFGFSSLTIALVLTLSKPFEISGGLIQKGFEQNTWLWAGTTGLMLLIVMIKMVLTYFWAWLFNAREVAGLQFFNWIRAMFLLSGLSLLVIVVSLIIQIQTPGWINFWLNLLLIGLLIWNIPISFKVANKVHLGLFHLFSYLCVTEIIPSIIIFKILYY